MDYSQKGQTNSQAFFTAGVGDTPVEQNNTGESLNTSSWSPDFELPDNSREIGGRAIQLSKERAEIEAASKQLMEEELKKAAVLLQPQAPAPEAMPNVIPVFDPKMIRTEGDKISRETLVEVGKTEAKFYQTGDTAEFYASIRGDENNPGMVRNNLKNSFNREVG